MAQQEIILQRFFRIGPNNEFIDDGLSTIDIEAAQLPEEELIQQRLHRYTWESIHALAVIVGRRRLVQEATGRQFASLEQPSLEQPIRRRPFWSWKGAILGAAVGATTALVSSIPENISYLSFTMQNRDFDPMYYFELSKYYASILDHYQVQGQYLAAGFLVFTGFILGGALKSFKRA